MTKTKKQPAPIWLCECGCSDTVRPTDKTVEINKAVFRRAPCEVCRRPMQLDRSIVVVKPRRKKEGDT